MARAQSFDPTATNWPLSRNSWAAPPGRHRSFQHEQPGQPGDIASVDRLLNSGALVPLLTQHGRTQVTAALRNHLASLRQEALDGSLSRATLAEDAIAAALESRLTQTTRTALRPVFNLSGTVLHTNLGRALLPEEAVHAVGQALTAAVNLEFDLHTGRRGERDRVVEGLLCELTGAEAATVVNNNAAAVLLMGRGQCRPSRRAHRRGRCS